MERLLNALASVALIVACGVFVARNISSGSSRETRDGGDRYAAGDEIVELPPSTLASGKRTVFLFLNSQCRYCTNSMPLYRELRSQIEQQADTRFVIGSSEPESTVAAYLDAHGLTADEIITLHRTAGGKLRGTPTLAVLNGSQRIVAVWYGERPSTERSQILSAVRGGIPLTSGVLP